VLQFCYGPAIARQERSMDWLQFIAAVIGHVAWPIVVLVLLIMLRSHIGALAERLEKLSFGSASISFTDILSKNAELIKEAPKSELPAAEPQLNLEPPQEPSTAQPAERKGSYIKDSAYAREGLQGEALWKTTAQGQVLLAFEEINQVIHAIAGLYGWTDMIGHVVDRQFLVALMRTEEISVEVFDLYISLGNARDLVAHGKALPNQDEVLEYIRQAEYVKVQLLKVFAKKKEEKKVS
jgi:hypothetical protein